MANFAGGFAKSYVKGMVEGAVIQGVGLAIGSAQKQGNSTTEKANNDVSQDSGGHKHTEASGAGKSSSQLEFEQKNTNFVTNKNVKAYQNDDGVNILEVNLVVDEGRSYGVSEDMNEAWNTEIMTDKDGNKYQGKANIKAATLEQKMSKKIDVSIVPCKRCNTVQLAPGAQADAALGWAQVAGNEIELPRSRLLFRRSTPGHELGHNLGLRNCSSCDSLMSPSTTIRANKATLQDIKILYDAYKKD